MHCEFCCKKNHTEKNVGKNKFIFKVNVLMLTYGKKLQKTRYDYTKNIKQNHFNYLSDFHSLIFKVVCKIFTIE